MSDQFQLQFCLSIHDYFTIGNYRTLKYITPNYFHFRCTFWKVFSNDLNITAVPVRPGMTTIRDDTQGRQYSTQWEFISPIQELLRTKLVGQRHIQIRALALCKRRKSKRLNQEPFYYHKYYLNCSCLCDSGNSQSLDFKNQELYVCCQAISLEN